MRLMRLAAVIVAAFVVGGARQEIAEAAARNAAPAPAPPAAGK